MDQKTATENKQKSWVNRHPIATVTIIVVIFIIFIGIIGGNNSNNVYQTTASPQTATNSTSPLDSFSDGIFIVGKDIQAGMYENTGGQNCYYARLSGFGGTNNEIISNNNTNAVAIVTILPTDAGFESERCGTWNNISKPSSDKSTAGTPSVTTNSTRTTSPTSTASAAPTAPALSISCSTSQTSLTLGQTAIWTAQSSGGTGSYAYAWSGTDGLSGSNQSITKSYLIVGTKSASVNVTSGSQSVNQACNGTITVSSPAPQAINLSGSGQQATQQFNLQAGISIFTLSYSGSGNFSVWLVDQNGNNVALLANVVGSFNGSIATGIQSVGSYLLNVQADGPWSVNITQPRPTSAPSTTSFNGNSQEATSFFHLLSGLHVFNMNYSGSDNFSVWLVDQYGNNVDLLANTVGSFNGSQAEGIDNSGIYLLNVQGSGEWTISIK